MVQEEVQKGAGEGSEVVACSGYHDKAMGNMYSLQRELVLCLLEALKQLALK